MREIDKRDIQTRNINRWRETDKVAESYRWEGMYIVLKKD